MATSNEWFRRLAGRIGKSLAYRSGPMYREVLGILPEPRVEQKNLLAIPLVTMCGREHLLQLEQLLYTIAVRWRLLPKVVAVSDGSVSEAQIRERLRWWPAGVESAGWQRFRDFHREKGRAELARYAEKDQFGRKLSTILGMAEQGRALWCDCDILFFSDFSGFIERAAAGAVLETAEDFFYAYDPRLVEGRLKHLLSRPPVNTGLVLCDGSFYERCGLSEVIEEGIHHCMYLTEQTILAEAVFQAGRIAWNLEVVKMFNDDESTLRPTHLGKNWVARHYVGPIRHLFWRDALAVRWGIGKGA
jgi:hypothetical protein